MLPAREPRPRFPLMTAPTGLRGRARAAFRAVAETVVPEAATLEPAQWDELEAIVAHAVAARPPRVRRQLTLLLHLLEWLPLLRYGRPFSRLDPTRRARLLGAWQTAFLLLLRRGVWGVRTLALMGYYGRPAAAGAIGYRADARGWDARR